MNATASTAKVVGGNVVAARRALGWTSARLAKESKLDRSHVWRIEHGEIEPTLSTLERLARPMGTTVGALLIHSGCAPAGAVVTPDVGGRQKVSGRKARLGSRRRHGRNGTPRKPRA